MIRYCPKCDQEYDFKISSMGDMEQLSCPVCGEKIDKNSRRPHDYVQEAKTEIAIGTAIYKLISISFLFFLFCGIMGVIAYVFHWDTFLYIDTAICVVIFLWNSGRDSINPLRSSLWLIVGAGLGYLIFKSIRGACLGVMVSLIVRHFVRALLIKLFTKFIKWVRRL